MRSLLPIWNLVTRRAASNRLLLSVLALGVLVASILLASAPIYARTMSDLGLTFSIREELPSGPGTRVIVRDVPVSEAGDPLREAVSGRVQDRIGWFTRATELFERTGPIPVGKPGEERPANGPAVQLQSLTGWEPQVAVAEGELPSGFDSEGRLEVAIDPQSAEFMELQPGDPLELRESIDDCEQVVVEGDGMPSLSPCPDGTPTLQFDYTIPAVVSGIVQPIDPESEFWIAGLNQYFRFQRNSPIANPTFSAWIEPGTFTGEFADRYPGYAVDITWNAYANPEAINQATLDRARVDLDGLRIETQSVDGITASPVANVLDRFATESSYRQAPLTILLLQVAAIALFYVALAASVVVDRQSPEIALLRSRGASIRQVLTVYLLEGLIIGVPVLLLAPFIAAALTSAIGLLPVFEDVSGGELLPATVTPAAFGYAAIGVGLSLLAVLVPAFVIARRSAVAQRRVEARPGKPFFQRFYLDFVLVGFAALLLWELNERGSAFQPSPTGGVSSDPVLLASPALIIVAGAALLMRFVPIIMRWLGRLVVPAAGASLAGAFWQIVRSPGQYMRLAILLMMAIAVGTFAASYSSTADRSYRDRANFQAGVDLRGLNMSRFTNLGSIPEAEGELATAEGVEDASMVLRTDASPATSGAAGRSIDLLGVDPEAVAPMLYTRDDFADESIESLLFGLRGQPAYQGIELPEDTRSLSIWAHTAEPRESVTFWGRVRDAEGRIDLVEFGSLEFTGWTQLTASLESGRAERLEGPLELLGFVFTEPPNRFNSLRVPLYLDDLEATIGGGETVLIDGFEGSLNWLTLPQLEQNRDEFSIESEEVQSGESAGRFDFRLGSLDLQRGLYLGSNALPISGIASSQLLGQLGAGVGSTIYLRIGDVLVPVRISGEYDLFPTLPTSSGPSLVVNRDQLISWSNAFNLSGGQQLQANEVWVDIEPGASTEAARQQLGGPPFHIARFSDRAAEIEDIESNPLIAAGGSGILQLSFFAVLLLVGAALLLSLWMAVQRRRVEFAVLRAMGLSRGQVLRQLALEYAIVGVIGMAAGVYLGTLVGRRMLSFLDVTASGERVEPGFILQTDWSIVAISLAAVGVIFIVGLAFAVRALSRTSDAQALRTE